MKTLTLLVGAGLVAGSWAGAQEALVFKSYSRNITLQRCTKPDAKRVVCDGSFISISDEELKFTGEELRLIDSTGSEVRLSGFIFKGVDQFNKDIKIVKNFKYPVQLVFAGYLPSSIKFMESRNYYFDATRYENVPLTLATSAPKPAAAAPAPTPASGAAINLGTTQAVLGGKAYTLTLNNCKANAAGMYTCAITTATPAR